MIRYGYGPKMGKNCPLCNAEITNEGYRSEAPKGRHCSRMRQAFTKQYYKCSDCNEEKTLTEWNKLMEVVH